jgi:hypothetical protein
MHEQIARDVRYYVVNFLCYFMLARCACKILPVRAFFVRVSVIFLLIYYTQAPSSCDAA